MFLTHLVCSACDTEHDAAWLQNLCTKCHKPLLAKYDLKTISRKLTRQKLRARADSSLWRFRELLPLPQNVEPVSLGEGGTPLLRADRFGDQLGLGDLWIKDESVNPTQSFKARGMSVAVSMAKHLGATKLAVPSAGNAGSALSAYAARAGLEAYIFMPYDTPQLNVIECCELGARVQLIDGLITDCAAQIARRKTQEDWFEMSTLKEPYRLEGKKTLGYELAEQLGWWLPDVILIQPAVARASLEYGKRSRNWKRSVGSTPNVHACIPFRHQAARRSFVRSKPAPSTPPNFQMRRPAPRACACRKRSAIFSS